MEKALSRWTACLHEAEPYLTRRGITIETGRAFSLGVVASSDPGFEKYFGRLVIPYMDRLGPVGFQFRCIDDHSCKEANCPKYLQLDDQKVGFFNVLSLDSDEEVAHICEGEIDAITLSQVVEGPVLAVSGVGKWLPHFQYHLTGFERVVVWADGDSAGGKMSERIRDKVRNADVVSLPQGEDVNSLYVTKGGDYIRSLYEEDPDV